MKFCIKKKNALPIIALVVTGLGMQVNSLAQAANDSGTLNINGQISATTCVLDMGDSGSTSAGAKTLNLGTYTTAAASGAAGATFGTAQTVLFKVTNSDGSACSQNGSSKWDIGINLTSTQYTTVAGSTLLLSGGTSATAAGNVGVLIKTSVGPSVTAGTTNLDLSKGAIGYGTLLSGGTSTPGANFTDKIALTAQFAKTTATNGTAGTFTATIPLNVWYK